MELTTFQTELFNLCVTVINLGDISESENYKMLFYSIYLYSAIFIFPLMFRITLSRDAPVVELPSQGQILGFFFKMFRTQTIVGYLGIPYAQPPTEKNRFGEPLTTPLPSWEGIRNGKNPPMQCWSNTKKPIKNHDEIFFKILGIDPNMTDSSQFSEDCLYINIFVPDGK